jgi:hypothetical protein
MNHTTIDAYNLDSDSVVRNEELKEMTVIVTFVDKDLTAQKKLDSKSGHKFASRATFVAYRILGENSMIFFIAVLLVKRNVRE